MGAWEIEIGDAAFEKFYLGLPEYEQAVLTAAIEHVLAVQGIDVCNGEWGKPLGNGLYEFRVRRSLRSILTEAARPIPEDLNDLDRQVLLRVFCTFYGNKVVLILDGYNKKKDSSKKRQNKAINQARTKLNMWKRRRSR